MASGPVGHRQRGHQGLQELRLARAGRTGHQAVRPVADQVERERAVERVVRPRPWSRGRRRATALTIAAAVGSLQAEDLQQARGRRQRSLALVVADVAQRREPASGGREPAVGHLVGEDAVDLRGALLTEDSRPAVAPDEDGRALLREGALVGVDADAVDADRRALLQDRDHSGQRPQPSGAVHHHDDVRVGEHGTRRRR